MTPTIGRIVHYALTKRDLEEIDQRLSTNLECQTYREGDIAPMVITMVHCDDLVNGKVLLDGNFDLWRPAVIQDRDPAEHDGPHPGYWAWPPRV